MCCVPLSSSDDEEMLFNPDCTVQLLVDDIKRRCGCDKSSECVFTHLSHVTRVTKCSFHRLIKGYSRP